MSGLHFGSYRADVKKLKCRTSKQLLAQFISFPTLWAHESHILLAERTLKELQSTNYVIH